MLPPTASPDLVVDDEPVRAIDPLARCCTICGLPGHVSTKCSNCLTCFKPQGECGFTKLPISNPCGTSKEELAAIVEQRKKAKNAYKLERKALNKAKKGNAHVVVQ
jgi:hypothetical protein